MVQNIEEKKRVILEILEKENIRFYDGRYSMGFVDMDALQEVINAGLAEIIMAGVRFVSKKPVEQI